MTFHSIRFFCLCALIGLSSAAWSARVYVMSSDNAPLDNAVVSRLQAGGHTVTLGVAHHQFTGTQNLSNIDVIYIQPNHNYSAVDMPGTGQAVILNWMTRPGKGIVTGEWTSWLHGGGGFSSMKSIFAIQPNTAYRVSETVTFNLGTSDAILNAGLPASFSMPIESIGGTETFLVPKSGATVFYRSDYQEGGENNPVLTGWQVPFGGRALHFGTVNGLTQINDVNFGRLLSNAMTWAASGTGQTPNVYIMSSGDDALDQAVAGVLTANGLRPYIGAPSTHLTHLSYLATNVTVFYLQYNHVVGATMPDEGQQALLNWLGTPGRGLVTAEWILYYQGYEILKQSFAATSSFGYHATATSTFSRRDPDPVLNAGMPVSFTFPTDNLGGTESFLIRKPGATHFYCSEASYSGYGLGGLIGWNYGSGGRVLHFSTVNGINEVMNANFGRLLANAMRWARSEGALHVETADINEDGCVNDEDLLAVLFNFGLEGCLRQDIDGDGIVSDGDLLLVLFAFGQGC